MERREFLAGSFCCAALAALNPFRVVAAPAKPTVEAELPWHLSPQGRLQKYVEQHKVRVHYSSVCSDPHGWEQVCTVLYILRSSDDAFKAAKSGSADICHEILRRIDQGERLVHITNPTCVSGPYAQYQSNRPPECALIGSTRDDYYMYLYLHAMFAKG